MENIEKEVDIKRFKKEHDAARKKLYNAFEIGGCTLSAAFLRCDRAAAVIDYLEGRF